MTAEMWGRFCMKIAEEDLENLELVASAARSLLPPQDAQTPQAAASSTEWVEV